MKKIGIIGHFGGNKLFTDGQTVKTKEINNQIEKKYKVFTKKFDTYKQSHNPFKLLRGILCLLKNCDIIVLIVSSRGYKIINPILAILNKIYKKRLFDFVIGGTRYKVYDKSRLQKKSALLFEKIYVETVSMKKEYNLRNIYNVEVFPNFKCLSIEKNYKPNNEKLKLCTFSRIRKEKGIEDSIAAVNLANKIIGKNVIVLDIYGNPDSDYQKQFESIIKVLPNCIHYKGSVEPHNSTKVIKKYDAMLFLTYWSSEGLPGTIIDSFFSGVPVIATNWNCNFEVLKNNYTGIKVEVNDVNTVANLLVSLYNNREKLVSMRKNCLKEAEKYSPDNIMEKFYRQIDK